VASHNRPAIRGANAATAVTRPSGSSRARIPQPLAPAPSPSHAPSARPTLRPTLASKEARPRGLAATKRRIPHRAHRRSGRR
jgi:hypothetical protein